MDRSLGPLPQFIHKIPARAAQIITNSMDLPLEHNWRYLATELWPNIPRLELDIAEQRQRTSYVISKLGGIGGTSHQLLEALKNINRVDVILQLQEEGYDVRMYL